MKALEDRLDSASATPRRPLGTDFTANVMAGVRDGVPEPKRRPKWKEYIQMKLTRKSAISTAACVVIMAAGGSAFAAVGGVNGISAFFGGQKTLADGDRIVTVHTQDCSHVDAFNITNKDRTSSDSYYYRIKADSKLSNSQVVHMVQGYCEADAESAKNGKALQPIAEAPENKDKLVGGYADSIITALTPTTISLRSNVTFVDANGKTVSRALTQVFGHIDPHAVVIANGVVQPFGTLKVGDHVSVKYRAAGEALAHSETIRPDQIDYSAQTVVVAIRVSRHVRQYQAYATYNSKDFTRVVPCKTTTSGYCTIDQYLHK